MNNEEIKEAMRCRTIGQTNMDERRTFISAAIRDCYAMKHQSIDDSTLSFETGKLEDKLSHTYPYLTCREVKLALEAGVCGELDGVGSVTNIANMINWIAAYARSSERSNALAEAKADKIEQEYKSSLIIKKQKIAEYNRTEPAKMFADYRAKGRTQYIHDLTFPQYVATVYDAIKDHIRQWSRTLDIKAKTAEWTDKAAKEMRRRTGRKDKLADIINQGANNATLRDYCKAECLYDYFDYLITNNLELA